MLCKSVIQHTFNLGKYITKSYKTLFQISDIMTKMHR